MPVNGLKSLLLLQKRCSDLIFYFDLRLLLFKNLGNISDPTCSPFYPFILVVCCLHLAGNKLCIYFINECYFGRHFPIVLLHFAKILNHLFLGEDTNWFVSALECLHLSFNNKVTVLLSRLDIGLFRDILVLLVLDVSSLSFHSLPAYVSLPDRRKVELQQIANSHLHLLQLKCNSDQIFLFQRAK